MNYRTQIIFVVDRAQRVLVLGSHGKYRELKGKRFTTSLVIWVNDLLGNEPMHNSLGNQV